MVASYATHTVEREAKLVADADFQLPDLSGLINGAIAASMPTRQLDAVYYDTTDLRLARWGMTLRYRSGESGPPWTVKLPHTEHGPALSRREIGFDGLEGEIPAAAVDLVTAVARSRRLRPVVRLCTTRQPVQISDPEGGMLAEAVDDTVSVWSDQRQLGEFREVEVEVYQDGRDGGRLLRKAIRRLTAAGCDSESPVPKLVRALGTRAAQPPDVTVTPLADDATVADLIQHAIARSVAQIIRHDPGVRLGDDPEDVRQLRVGTRRLRSDLRTVRKPWKALAGAVTALGDNPSDAELHQVRILAKRCRYAAEAVTPLTKPSAARFAAAIADVQTVLGDHQDTVVAEAWLRDTVSALPAARVAAGELIALERTRRAELRARWPAVWRAASTKDLRRWL